MLARRIEEASLNAWPALQQMVLDGWWLRFSGGYTKRANSVNPLYESQEEIETKVDFCERMYQALRLPTIFRLTPFAHPLALDQVLENRGYRYADQTMVMHRDLVHLADELHDLDYAYDESPSVEGWLSILCQLRQEPLSDHALHRSILETILGRTLFASLTIEGQHVSCGLGVLEGEMVGVFDVLTGQAHRNMGYGKRLMVELLTRARQLGARHAYLQVMCNNAAARHLYTRLGFRELYTYWYRIRPLEEH